MFCEGFVEMKLGFGEEKFGKIEEGRSHEQILSKKARSVEPRFPQQPRKQRNSPFLKQRTNASY